MGLRGVVTTGIYCQADCKARPSPSNVRPMRNAVEAQAAGFRPCLLCRPDRLPGLGIEQPAAEIASAVRLIAEGFLDSATTEQLADRIGYSTRHLVRLFQDHIGATPDFVARSRRAHLARRLLDESDLSISQIAVAAGFLSIRQMNRVMRELFGFSPSMLRQKRQRGDALDPLDGGLRLRLPYAGKLDGQSLVRYLGARAIPGVETLVDDTYRRTMVTCGFPGVVDVRDPRDGGHMEISMHLATFGSIVDQVERVRSLFGIHQCSAEAEGTLRRDEVIGPLVRRRPGLRLAGAWDRFETSVRIIVGQQVSVAGASTIAGRLAARFGETVQVGLPGGLRYLFPSPDALARADLRDIGMPSARARTIVAFARAVASGEIDLSRVAPLEDVCAELEALPGIGPWTSHLIAARAMGHPDAFASSDLGLRKGAARLLGHREPLSTRDVEALAERWRPHRTTAMAYLWMSPAAETPRRRHTVKEHSSKAGRATA
ncbi:MAG: helix-turn-helix domain-containing protein [Myxococcales bacterium]|nr:helix-turn-helix domain-containing protein [Myxococcales bacterium]